MSYPTSMQIFIDARGKAPLSEREEEDIKLILSTLKRAGVVLSENDVEASNAPLVLLVAWIWARVVGKADVIAGLRETVESTVQLQIAELGEQIAANLRKHEEIDLALKTAPGDIVAQVDHLLGERIGRLASDLQHALQSPGAPPPAGGALEPAASEPAAAPANHTEVFKAGRAEGAADWKAYFLTAAVGVLIGVLLIGAWKLGQHDGAAESRKAIALAQQLSAQCGPASGPRHVRR